MPFQRTKKLLTITLLATVVISVAYGILVYRIHSQELTAKALETELLKYESQEKHNKETQDLIDSTVAERDILEGYFIHPDEIVDFISFIELLASEGDVLLEISSVKPKELPGYNHLETLEFETNAQGRWEDIYTLLTLIDRMPYQHTIVRSYLEHLESNMWSLTITFEVGMIKES